MAYRLAAWLVAVASLFVVTLTVSRGALVAVAVSLLVASRKLMKVGVLPILLLTGLSLGVMATGIFDQAIDAYTHRAGEESGRLRVWPLMIQKFFDSPIIGVGASRAGAWISPDRYTTPHNSFLLFAVASGFIPLALFCAYCFRSGMAALRANMEDRDSAFYLPLVTYTVLVTSAGNTDFMLPWAVVSLAMPVAAGVARSESKARRPQTLSL
jgi:O-antigen ligase